MEAKEEERSPWSSLKDRSRCFSWKRRWRSGGNVTGEGVVMEVEKLKERGVGEMRRNGSGEGRVDEFKADDADEGYRVLGGACKESSKFMKLYIS